MCFFSGDRSRFYDLLFTSGLILEAVPKSRADEIVFGSTSVNYNRWTFGVIDLIGRPRVVHGKPTVTPSATA
jgi:hypothetical protein